MLADFDLKRAFYAVIGGAFGAIYGYVLGIEIYLINLAISAPSSSTITITAEAQALSMLFALLLGTLSALGVFEEYSASSKGSKKAPSQENNNI